MAIKKRTSLPVYVEGASEPVRLNIVAKPKQPMPEGAVVQFFGDPPDQRSMLRLGLVAQSCGDAVPDARMNVTDYVALLRTPFDKNNPQEARYRNRIKNRATAITAMCITCTGSRKLVTECAATDCPLWSFRFGGDPFRGKRK